MKGLGWRAVLGLDGTGGGEGGACGDGEGSHS